MEDASTEGRGGGKCGSSYRVDRRVGDARAFAVELKWHVDIHYALSFDDYRL